MAAAVAKTFAALGDPVRSTIVDRLATGDATVGELAGLFAITFQAVSQHIGILERAGLVSRSREGRHRRAHLEPQHLEEAGRWMDGHRRRLEERYRRLDDVLAAELAAGADRGPSDPVPAPTPDPITTRDTIKDRK